MAAFGSPRAGRIITKPFVLLAAIAELACETNLVGSPVEPRPGNPHEELPIFDPVGCVPTSESIRATLFEPACAGGICHGPPTPALGLDLVSMAADSLVGRSAAGCEGH